MRDDVPLPCPPLTRRDRHDLLRLARDSIAARLCDAPGPALTALTPGLSSPGAAFVSLHIGERLRGCVGTLADDRPLLETVAHMAISAAVHDPRFPPVTAGELEHIAVEISRLGAMVPIRAEAVCPGRHGVSITAGEHRAVFLPQVARLYHWDREMLLAQLCEKALLPATAWRDPAAQLLAFTAEVFAEGGG